MNNNPRIFILSDSGKFPNYENALRAAQMTPVCSHDSSTLSSCDGILLPGGGDAEPSLYGQENAGSKNIDSTRDKEELAVISLAMCRNKPILGICRGHQMINVALGGTLIQHLPTTSRHSSGGDDDTIHPTHASGYLAALYGESFLVNSSHHQAIDRLGKGLCAIQWSDDDNIIEGIVHTSLPILGVQWHPERCSPEKLKRSVVDGSAVFQHFRNLC